VTANLQETIRQQRTQLTALLSRTMRKLAAACAARLNERSALEQILSEALAHIAYCKHLYVLDAAGQQLTDNITHEGHDSTHFGRDRSLRPYMRDIIGSTDFKLSNAYISRNKKRPSLTAIQVIRDAEGQHIGFLGADYDLRELPGSEGIYQEPDTWRQIKGDPAIRGGLFLQCRIDSTMDRQLDTILPLLTELMVAHGVFHGKLHFSSNRATIWLMDDPYIYRILNIDELTAPDTCLAYPHRPYPDRAIVPPSDIAKVFALFRTLRFADDNIYLRAGSLNLCNGLVALNFSCDGSHYLRYDDFLSKGIDLWFGALSVPG